MNRLKRPRLAVLLMLLWHLAAFGQDSEPRRWTHLPVGVDVIGVGIGGGTGDIFLDPALQIEDATFDRWSLGLSWVHTFGLLGRSARIDVQAPYVMGRWEGILAGQPASTRRHGFADPQLRFSWLLVGGEALDARAWASTPRADTVVGLGLSVRPPLGEYYPERLINLGTNRWTVRPQLGVTHTRGPWTGELTGSVFLFTDNDDLAGQRQENDPLWAIQAHLIRNFRPGFWVSLSTAYGDGSDVTIDGVPRDQRTENWLVALAVGMPVGQRQNLKIAWVRARTQRFDGTDSDDLVVAWSWLLP